MLHLATAPMPFIMGLHRSLVPDMARMPLEEIMLVDLDADQISEWDGPLTDNPVACCPRPRGGGNRRLFHTCALRAPQHLR